MALMALAQRTLRKGSRSAYVVGILGIFGASLFFGDGVITPAITVMGAVEGLEVAAPGLGRFVVPIALVVLAGLFAAQRFGTERVGKVFGPVMVLWFLALAAIGVWNVVAAPEVLKAFGDARIPAGPVYSPQEALDDAHIQASGILRDLGVLVQSLNDHLHGHRRFAFMPDVIVCDVRHDRIAHLGFAREERLRRGGHADDGHAPTAIGVRFGFGGKARTFDGDEVPAAVRRRACLTDG